jgi:uncharacterized DUF497 family protein
MEFEWDENKNRRNFLKHGVDFDFARLLFDGRPSFKSEARSEIEPRIRTTGVIDGVFYKAIWTPRARAIRIISPRRARDEERREYRSVHGGRD